MKHGYIILLLLVVLGACNPHNTGNVPDKALTDYDSVYVIADIQWHKQYYPLLDKQVFSIDLLSDGLAVDSAHHIVGTGVNLYFSDIFVPLTDSVLTDGTYRMDSVAGDYRFLPYMSFEGNVTGCYILDIQESKINRITGFTAGELTIRTEGEDMHMDILLYLADSTHYRASYDGPAMYR